MAIQISSAANPRVKETLALAKHAERARRHETVVEGEREVRRALAAGIIPHTAFVCPPLLSPAGRTLAAELSALDQARRTLLVEVTPELFAKLAYRGDSGGLLLVIPYPDVTLDSLSVPHPAFIAVIEGVEKPGNLGAILRTADAAGVHAVIVAAGATDLHNPNVVRASLGTLFTVPVVEAATEETITWLRQRAIRIIAARPDASLKYTAVDYTGPVAIVMGAEAGGLGADWAQAANLHVTIPMFGQADSLNLATSTALLLYEVVRQRSG
ncbi:MAG: RNA methyltransferase [Caldilineaceae bacterium]|nr:RNA methyltransferase [Caldilineaceae bacterium]